MRKWLVKYFDVTKGEYNGLLVLFVLIILVTMLPVVYPLLRPFKPDLRLAQQAKISLDSLLQLKPGLDHSADRSAREGMNAANKRFAKEERPLHLTTFDPNTTDQQGWEDLGFSLKQAQSILKYVAKGGKFRKPEDLQKMFVVSAEAYQRLQPYIRINAALFKEPDKQWPVAPAYIKQPATVIQVEINGADSTELEKIRGIGPAFARRIIHYRERLGGFHKKEQLMEVFGLDTVKFSSIKDQVFIDLSLVKMVNINTVKYEDFKNNPYLRYKQVNAILQYREQHGNYSNFEDLKKVAILSPETLEKLLPYLLFTP
ncbi:ComEA family DNA-binding protein [Pedobacter sp.]|uniref:ComEA family DNA-binding protein n=1 Tax=Pedobacter sp. TaxID=1411316 RepID=UPI003D7FC4CC